MRPARALLPFVVLFAAGCASGPALDSYSRREIDRPYTLPKGVATWEIPAFYYFASDRTYSEQLLPVPIPLVWTMALSDDWNLKWFLIVPTVSHQLSRSEDGWTGASLFANFGYRSGTGLFLLPTATFAWRRVLAPNTALDARLRFTPKINLGWGYDFRWSAGATAGPLFQLTDVFALEPLLEIDVSHRLEPASTLVYPLLDLPEDTWLSAGLGLKSVWSLGRQWDFRATYTFSGIGSPTDIRAHIGVLEFIHFW